MKKLMTAVALAAALVAVLPTLVGAIDFTSKLSQLDGSQFKDQTGKDVETTLGSVAESALVNSYADEQNLPGEEKFRRYQLASKIHGADRKNLVLSPEETALLKKLIAKAFPPLVVGKAWELLDPSLVLDKK